MKMSWFLLILSISLFNVDAIISPPNAFLNISAEIFNQWRTLRAEFINSMNYSMGLPHFNCSRGAYEPAVSVHQLHPSHIGVIAALGDSVSVAQAAKSSSLSDILLQYPGVSFVTGDDVALNEQSTLINIFRQFSPNIKGGSSDRIRKFYDFNVAVPGSFSSELPEQARKLAGLLKKKLGKDNSKLWKLLNIFIGHNDLCHICQNETAFGPETFGKSVKSALSIIEATVPNVFVNIMAPINVQIHTQAHNVSKFCELSHRKSCSCIFDLSKEEYSKIKERFDEQLKRVVQELNAKFHNSTTFTVVIAPAMDLKTIPTLGNQPNIGLLALDCFHLSTITHDIAAKQIWKGLFQPVHEKTVTDQTSVGFDRFVCPPQECPYIRTDLNSNVCNASKAVKALALGPYPASAESTQPPYIVPGFLLFLIGSALIILFVVAVIRRPSTSSEFSNERLYLLLPTRADLNDNIF